MDLVIKTESEKYAKKELENLRKQRLLQVRQQSKTVMANARKKYQAEKAARLQEVIDEAVTKRTQEFEEVIKQKKNDHVQGMHQIGAAHRAAELFNQMDLPKVEQAKKIQRDNIATKRHFEALKTKWERENKDNEAKLLARQIKDETRKHENTIAKTLVYVKPYPAVPVQDSSVKTGRKKEPLYPPSPMKYLQVPGVAKSPKKKRRSGPGILNEKKKPDIKKPTKSLPNVFGIVVDERAAGAAPPIVRQRVQTKAPPPKQTKATKDFQKGDYSSARSSQQVTFLDASIPLPPIHYRAPPGLAQPISRESVSSNAWLNAEEVNAKAQLVEKRRLQDIHEMRMKAEVRGQKALRIAKLEQRYKKLETDLLDSNQVQGFQPVLDSSSRNSFLGFEDPEAEDEQDRNVQEANKTPSKVQGKTGARSLPLTRKDQLGIVSPSPSNWKAVTHFLDDESEEDSDNVQLLEIKQNKKILKPKLKLERKEGKMNIPELREKEIHKLHPEADAGALADETDRRVPDAGGVGKEALSSGEHSPEVISEVEEGTFPLTRKYGQHNLHEGIKFDLRRFNQPSEERSPSFSGGTRLSSIDENTESPLHTLSIPSTPTGSGAMETTTPRARRTEAEVGSSSSNESSSSSGPFWDFHSYGRPWPRPKGAQRLNISRSFTMHSSAIASGFFSSTPERPYSTTRNDVGKQYMHRLLEMRRESVQSLAVQVRAGTSGSSTSTDDSLRVMINSSACQTSSSSGGRPEEPEYSPRSNHQVSGIRLRNVCGPPDPRGGGDNFQNPLMFEEGEEFDMEEEEEEEEEDDESEEEDEDDDEDDDSDDDDVDEPEDDEEYEGEYEYEEVTTSQSSSSKSDESPPVTTINSSSSASTMAEVGVGVVCSPRQQSNEGAIPPANSAASSLTDALNSLCIQQQDYQRTSTARGQQTSPPTSSVSVGTSTVLSQARRELNVGRENQAPGLEAPSGCSSIRSVSSSSSSHSKEVNRGGFGTDLGNTMFSSSVQSEQHTTELSSASSAIRKMQNEWSKISIEKPPWWQA